MIGVAQVLEEGQRAAEQAARPLREMTAELGRQVAPLGVAMRAAGLIPSSWQSHASVHQIY